MCGICGVIGAEPAERAEAVARRMMAAMRHRGPDDEGLLAAPGATLGMRRLSIIDIAGGQQPQFNEDGTVAVVFNGEIYNFRDLRQELESKGHVFRTRSDTEAIVHAYEEWGEDCSHHLRGMFAFAVLDRRAGCSHVLLARDRLGIKPLYYAWADGALFFASEVRALVASGRVAQRLSRPALGSYLLFGSVAEPVTFVEGVSSLPPGHRLTVPLRPAAGSAPPQPQRYWDLAETVLQSAEPRERNLASAGKQVRAILEDAVRCHLIADVPLGVFLSGGLDSTALVALASREQRGLHTFTVAFAEQEFSEAELARQTAAHFGTEHQELLLSGEEMLARVDEAIAALDQPTMDGINTYFVSWAARQVGLKVALSGLGGDEVFGGYSTFATTPRMEQVARWARRMPRAARSATAPAAAWLGQRNGGADAGRKAALLWRSPDALPHPYYLARALFTPEQCAELCGEAGAAPVSAWRSNMEDAARRAERLDSFTAVSYLESRSYLPNTLLRDTDAVSMSHSLEVRVPLLDHRLVEFVARLPGAAKRRGGVSKALLVEALGELLPAHVAQQPKRTFTLPWEHWLRGALREKVARGLEQPAAALRPALDRQAVRAVWQDFLAGRTSWSRPWSLYVLNEWVRRHLDGATAQRAVEHPAVAIASARPS